MLQISASDSGEPPLTNSSVLTILLVDVDDVQPRFSRADYSLVLHPDDEHNVSLNRSEIHPIFGLRSVNYENVNNCSFCFSLTNRTELAEIQRPQLKQETEIWIFPLK